MKKLLWIIMAYLLVAMMLGGCATTQTADEPKTGQQDPATPQDIVDLTALSSVMVYAEVNNMMISPSEYLGRTVKMSGPYYASYYEETGLYYHYVIIQDATACCSQGLEFIWNGDHAYPEDYPTDGTIVEMTGVFGSYDELGITYYYIAVDDLTVV